MKPKVVCHCVGTFQRPWKSGNGMGWVVKHPSWLPTGLTGTALLVWAAVTRYLHFWVIQ